MERKNMIKGGILITATLALAIGCKRGDTIAPTPRPVNEEELITSVLLTFISTADPSDTFMLRWADPDGDGGLPAVITADTLPATTDFSLSVRVLNESVDPVEEITHEIEEEGSAHQFFFIRTGAAPLVTYADADENGAPIGLLGLAETTASGTGSLTVILRHMPDKAASGVSGGDITNAGGETDLEVVFQVEVR